MKPTENKNPLTLEQILRGNKWLAMHIEHVGALMRDEDITEYPPTDNEDKNNPALWKRSHWRWFLGYMIKNNIELIEEEEAPPADKILIAIVTKKFKFAEDPFVICYRANFVSHDRDKLKSKIEEHYKATLVKDEADDFPYFSDGGFKYSWEDENFVYDTQAHYHHIIK